MRVLTLLLLIAIVCGASVAKEGTATSAALQIIDKNGQPVSFCPLKHTSVTGHISGYVARVDVTQVFDNPSTEAVEAIYVFPMPSNAAVDYMEMRIGERVIRGEIKLRDLLTTEQPVLADETIALWDLVGARDTDVEAKLIAKMSASEHVKYLSMLRLSKKLKALKPDTVTIPGLIVIENGRVEVMVRSTDLSTEGMAKLNAIGFESTAVDETVHAAIGWIAIDKLADLAAQDGVALVDLPNYETK